jgi:colanic acid biosynthesis glycosyl transferase WcaI
MNRQSRNLAEMHILILSDRYIPEITAPSFRIRDHAQHWLRLGHEVTVVTCVPNFPQGEVFAGYRNRFYQVEWIDGVRVIRVWSYMTANTGTIKRTLNYVSFMLSAIVFFFRYPKFDVILATSPPLFVPVAGYALSQLRRRPWVFEIRDLWPASIEAVVPTTRWLLGLFTRLELFLYRKADRIVSLTDPFKHELTRRGIPAEKHDVVTNGVDLDEFDPEKVHIDARKVLGVGRGEFLAGYIGTVGLSQSLITLIEAAELCREDPDIVFLIMGGGAERAMLAEEARRRKLVQVIFCDFVQHQDVPSYLAALDVSIVHLKAHPLFRTVIPSKIFENMAMATPMVYAVEGHSAQIVAEAGAGVCIPSDDPAAMARAVRKMKQDCCRLREMGQRGRQAVVNRYSRRVKAIELIRSLNLALGRPAGDSLGMVETYSQELVSSDTEPAESNTPR